MMKWFTKAALVCVMMVGVTALAEEGKKKNKDGKPAAAATVKGIKGTIDSVNPDLKTVTVKVKKGADSESIVVQTDTATQIMVDGVAATLADLKAGMSVAVEPETGTATKITAKKAAEKGAGEKKKKA